MYDTEKVIASGEYLSRQGRIVSLACVLTSAMDTFQYAWPTAGSKRPMSKRILKVRKSDALTAAMLQRPACSGRGEEEAAARKVMN